MSGSLGLIEMILVFGAVLGVALVEWISLRRANRRAREASEDVKTGRSDP